MKHIYQWILAVLWIAFWMYWLIASFFAKKNIKVQYSPNLVRVLIILFLVVGLIFRINGFLRFISMEFMDPTIKIIGLILTSFGLGIAVWARICLGANWGVPMSLKKDPELITAGPYRLIRHPIYSGILLALLGTGLANMFIWFVILVIAAIYFVYSAQEEEKRLTQLLPIDYPEYKKHTKAMIPFIW
jgi:protein-S-isoprenylcysteine O-methyltransferase Ste14